MSFGNLSYLASIFIFAGAALAMEYAIAARRFKESMKLILLAVIICVLATFAVESVALEWQIWQYNETRTLGTYFFGAAIETPVFALELQLPSLFQLQAGQTRLTKVYNQEGIH